MTDDCWPLNALANRDNSILAMWPVKNKSHTGQAFDWYFVKLKANTNRAILENVS